LRQEGGRPVTPSQLLEGFLDMLWPRAVQLRSAGGPAELAEELRRRTATLGRRVRVQLQESDDPVIGQAVDLTDAGHLVLEIGGALRQVVAGDVVHLRPTDGRAGTQ